MLWFALICVVVFFAPKIWEWYFTPQYAAEEIVADTKALYSQRHDFVEVSASSRRFRDLDHRFYARAKSQFEALGFGYLVDMEDQTVSRQYPKMRTFVRLFLGEDGAVCGAAFHMKVRGWMRLLKLFGLLPKQAFYFDLETEFSDGTFLVTTNSFGADLSSEVAGIERQPFTQTAELDQMVNAHVRALETRCGEGVLPVRIHSVGEAWEMQHRLQDLKNAAKAGLGYVDHEQIARVMARTPGSESPVEAARDEEFAAALVRLRQDNLSGRTGAK